MANPLCATLTAYSESSLNIKSDMIGTLPSRVSGTREILPLTGVRFPLMMGVLIHHYRGITSGDRHNYGRIQVSYFFILSGFIMAAAYFPSARNQMRPVRFAVRRYSRLWPTLIISCCIVAPWFYADVLRSWHGGHVGLAFLRTIIISVLSWMLPPLQLIGWPLILSNGYAWFISVELSVGLFFPWCMNLIWKVKDKKFLLFLFVALPFLSQFVNSQLKRVPSISIFNLVTLSAVPGGIGWLPLMLFGAITYRCALVWFEIRPKHFSVRMIIQFFVLASLSIAVTGIPWSNEYLTIGCYFLFAISIWGLSANPSSLSGRMLSWRPLRWIGKRTYSIYMFSLGIYLYALPALATSGYLGSIKMGSPIGWTLALSSVTICGIIAYALIEMPAKEMLSRILLPLEGAQIPKRPRF